MGRTAMAPGGRDLARVIADNAASALFLLDARGVATYMNPAAEVMTGWTLAEVGDRPLHDVIHHTRPDGRPFPLEECDIGCAILALRPIRDHADVFIDRDGAQFPVVCSATPILEAGEWVGAVLEVRDVTAERRAEEERLRLLREAERTADRGARLQALATALGGALTRDDVAAAVVDQGVAALGARAGSLAVVVDGGATLEIVRAVGYPEDQVALYRRVPLEAPFPLADAVREGQAIWLCDDVERDARYPNLAELRRRNGGGAMAAIPVEAAGRVIGAIGLNFAQPRTFDEAERTFMLTLAAQCGQALERARLYEAERAARAEAEAANRAKLDFLAVMSHELRTPLNAIGGYAELMEMGVHGPVTEAQVADLARIQMNQRQLLRLINDLLNFVKLDAGHVEFAIEPVVVAEAFAAAEPAIEPLARARRIAFERGACPPELAVRADADKLRQILINLLSNAVKFTEPGGRVVLGAEGGDGHVRLRVADTGVGIPGDRLERIFDPFVQVDSRLTRMAGGTGLGLAISRDLARRMGGDITVESAPGVGSTFTLVLPAA